MAKLNIWDKENTIKLIQMYEQNNLLWNSSNENYKNKIKKQDAILDIANDFKCSPDEINKKLSLLLAQYRKEKFCLKLNLEWVQTK